MILSIIYRLFISYNLYIRSIFACILSLFISMFLIQKIIMFFIKNNKFLEKIRRLGLTGELNKQKTPSMGGIAIIIATLISTLIFAKKNIYIIILSISIFYMGLIGFIDDYIKILQKNKNGLKAKFKILSQIILGIIIGNIIFFHKNINIIELKKYNKINKLQEKKYNKFFIKKNKSYKTTIILCNNNEIDYSYIIKSKYTYIIFIIIVILTIIFISNGSNITDGIDGLTASVSIIIIITFIIYSIISNNLKYAYYLNIMYIPNINESIIISLSLIGSLIGFLFYNIYPAKIFMGDTGSLAIGAYIAILAILCRKELMTPILCSIFFIENISVLMQVIYFKYTKYKFGKGIRLFLMTPIHHHFQIKGYHEYQIVNYFCIIQIILSIISLLLLIK